MTFSNKKNLGLNKKLEKLSGLPKFSSWPLLILISFKPIMDAFYEIGSIKYIYMLALFAFAILAKVGKELSKSQVDYRNSNLTYYIFFIAAYFLYLIGLVFFYGGNFAEIFKIISPFILFSVLAVAADRWMIYAIFVSSVLTILLNAMLLPFDYGWVVWGAIKTFKGFYYFKTDLAYALTFSILTFSLYNKNKITPLFLILITLAAIEVILANSRLNYLTFLLVIIFIAFKDGLSIKSLLIYGAFMGVLIILFVSLYDSSKLLGFDTSNTEAFTQGRDVIWTHLIDSILKFTPSDWIFGKGIFGDLLLAQEFTPANREAHNAHNEILHLFYTQGLLGLFIYVLLWFKMFKMCSSKDSPTWVRGTGMVAVSIFFIQGLTTVVSSFATKTWPVAIVLFAIKIITWPKKGNK